MIPRALHRFTKYAFVGGLTFLLDLVLLYTFTDMLHMHYLMAAGIAFVIAVSCNYVVSRVFVFKHSDRGMVSGYLFFILIGTVGVTFVVSGMHVLVTMLGVHYLTARVLIASITGSWNYLMNLFVNFNVAGKL